MCFRRCDRPLDEPGPAPLRRHRVLGPERGHSFQRLARLLHQKVEPENRGARQVENFRQQSVLDFFLNSVVSLFRSINNAHKDWICGLAHLPGGQVLVSGCRAGIIKLWSTDTCCPVGEMKAHNSTINTIATNR